MSIKDKWKNLRKKFDNPDELEKTLNDDNTFVIKNKRLAKGVDVTVKVLNSKAVKKTTHAAKEVLLITEKVKSGNLLSVVAAGISSVDTIAGFIDIKKPDPFKTFIKKNKLTETTYGNLIELLSSPHVCDKIRTEPGPEFKDFSLIKHFLGGDNYIYTKVYTKKKDQDVIKWYSDYLAPAEFSIERAYEFLWDFYDGKAYVVKEANKYFKEALQLCPLTLDNCDLLIDEAELDRISEEVSKSRKNKKSRSYLLIGPPGTGKTSTAFKAADKFAPRILKIDPSVLEKISCGELEQFVSIIRPDALIFDDVDRCSWRNEEALLFLFENLKRSFPEMVIFATGNNYEHISAALRRPGRFDRVIWVLNPTWEERAEFINYFAKRLKLNIPKELFVQVVSTSRGFSQAYLAEMMYRATMDSDIGVSLLGSVKEFKMTLLLRYKVWDEEEVIPKEYRETYDKLFPPPPKEEQEETNAKAK